LRPTRAWWRRLRAPVAACAGALTLLSIAAGAKACNACREDKIAATYDRPVIAAAARRGHTVIFAAVSGPITPNDRARERRIGRRVASVPGVDPGSVRVSLEPAAVSFSCDLSRNPPAAFTSAINRALVLDGLSISIVQVGAPGQP